MASPIRITPLSAAQVLVSWITEHGREPKMRECLSSNGLLHFSTLTARFPGSTFSACISAARALVSSAPKPRMQTCLGPECEVRFLYQGYHFCATCRAELGYAEEDDPRNGRYLEAHEAEEEHGVLMLEKQYLPLKVREALSVEEMPYEVTGTSGEPHIYGFDDDIAQQMNAWSRLSRKRRYMGR